jgi:hypothetical protein
VEFRYGKIWITLEIQAETITHKSAAMNTEGTEPSWQMGSTKSLDPRLTPSR